MFCVASWFVSPFTGKAEVGVLDPAVPCLTKLTWAGWGGLAWESAPTLCPGDGVIADKRFEGYVLEAFSQIFMLISL